MNKLFCLVGPSGTGKDSIRKMLKWPSVISYRTRAMREGETEGVDGKFISREQFLRSEKEKRWIASTCYAEEYYGITKEELMPLKYTNLIYVIDYAGVQSLKSFFQSETGLEKEQVVTIFIDSPYEVLATRMRTQQRMADEIERRMSQYWNIDYPAQEMCDYIVYNRQGKLKETVLQVEEIIKKEAGKEAKKREHQGVD